MRLTIGLWYKDKGTLRLDIGLAFGYIAHAFDYRAHAFGYKGLHLTNDSNSDRSLPALSSFSDYERS